jgi:hypothetical protein
MSVSLQQRMNRLNHPHQAGDRPTKRGIIRFTSGTIAGIQLPTLLLRRSPEARDEETGIINPPGLILCVFSSSEPSSVL